MGRTEQSQGLAPPAIRKDIRAKQARAIVNKAIPALLASISRARKGAEGSELTIDPPSLSEEIHSPKSEKESRRNGGKKGKRGAKRNDDEATIKEDQNGSPKSKGKGKFKQMVDAVVSSQRVNDPFEQIATQLSPSYTKEERPSQTMSVRILYTDTLSAAHYLTFPPSSDPEQPRRPQGRRNVCILNMASPLRPGGGVLNGATSQEEFLCARTTLLPSLKETFYRLPEVGAIWTSDVLVFRDSGPLGSANGELGSGDRWWVDVVSAGMLRFPEVQGEIGEEKRYAESKDREMVERKIRAVLRVCCRKKVKKLVLGAWGCGAYGNPVPEIARLFRKVLFGESDGGKPGKKARGTVEAERWDGLEEVVFAITAQRMAEDFSKALGRDIQLEEIPGVEDDDDIEEDEEDRVTEELRSKINEIEGQISHVWNPDLKARLLVIMGGLRAQLREREGTLEGVTAEDPSTDNVEDPSRARSGSTSNFDDDLDEDEEDDYELSDQEEALSPRRS